MAKRGPNPSRKANWVAIRQHYERDPIITFTALGKLYNLSRFIISRKAAAEDWKKRAGMGSSEAAAIGKALEGVGDRPVDLSPEEIADAVREAQARGVKGAGVDEPPADKAKKEKERPVPLPLPNMLAGIEEPPDIEGLADEDDVVEYIPVGQGSQADVDEEQHAGDVITRAQASAVRRQIQIGRELQRLGVRGARRINAVLVNVNQLMSIGADSPEAQEALAISQWNARQLTLVNPDRETMAGLLKAMTDTVERGILIERRALGMDVKPSRSTTAKAVGPTSITVPNADAGPIIEPAAMEVVERLDAQAAWKMREMLQEHVVERRRAEIDIAKSKGS